VNTGISCHLDQHIEEVGKLRERILLMQKKLLFMSFEDESLKERGIVNKTLNARVMWTQGIKIIQTS